MAIALYLDEHIPADLAAHLRRLGYDVLTTGEAGRADKGLDDEDQLLFAAGQGRALLSFNHCDFAPMDTAWKEQGRAHAGIILCPQVSLSELVRRVQRHVQRVTAEQQHDLLLWA